MASNLEVNQLANTKQSASAEAGVGLEMEASMKVKASMTVSLNKMYKAVKNTLTTLLLAAIYVDGISNEFCHLRYGECAAKDGDVLQGSLQMILVRRIVY